MNMDSSSMSMSMSMPSSTMTMDHAGHMSSMSATASAAMASGSHSMDMGGMDHGMGMGGGDGPSCKISMLWNWYTIDACFLSEQWHITSGGMMAGSCIGVILLVMSLEFLRRASREYDAFIIRQHVAANPPPATRGTSESDSDTNKTPAAQAAPVSLPSRRSFKPSLVQQLVRSTLHMLQFAVAYFVMLLAMYFNGYIIISIIIGAFLGAFVFGWHSLTLPGEQRELTYCCG